MRCALLDWGFEPANKFWTWHFLLKKSFHKPQTSTSAASADKMSHRASSSCMQACAVSHALIQIKPWTRSHYFNHLLAASQPQLQQAFPSMHWTDGAGYKLTRAKKNSDNHVFNIREIDITSYVLPMMKAYAIVCFTFAMWIVEKFKLINSDWALCRAYSWPHHRVNDVLYVWHTSSNRKLAEILKLLVNDYWSLVGSLAMNWQRSQEGNVSMMAEVISLTSFQGTEVCLKCLLRKITFLVATHDNSRSELCPETRP